MSFPRYPEYKDSGVEWLGQMPDHWATCALKRIAFLQSGDTISADSIADEGEYPVYGGNGLRGYTSIFNHDGHYPLIGRQGALCGNINYATGKFWASEHAVVVLPTQELEPVWLGELLRTMNLGQYSVSAAQPGLSVETICNLRVPIPSLPEQKAISLFLMHETAKIDALIAEQQSLIDLLKEKRQAVISHAVTKGLNPDVPMKDSGIEWLGEVPAHWSVTRVKHIIASIAQGWSPQCEGSPAQDGNSWGVLKVGCVNGGVFNPMENKALPDSLQPDTGLAIKKSDLLISRANTRELVGGAAVADRDFPNLLLCDKLYRLRLLKNICHPEYLAFFLASSVSRGQIELAATGASASMVNIAQSTVLDLAIALPDIDEQSKIISSIKREFSRLSDLVGKSLGAIDLLQERRTALISAAVTGKIDVRGIAQMEAA